MQDIKFLVPGVPVPKGRARMTKAGHTFTPERTVLYENLVRTTFTDRYPNLTPITEPIKLYVTFKFPIPASAKRKRGPDKILDWDPYTNRPDLDNLVKSVLDGLNQVAFADDKQITCICAMKIYGEPPCAMVSLRPVNMGGTNDD